MTPTTPATPQGVPPPADPGELESDKMTVDAGQVRVDNVSARLSKDRKLRIRMDLYNETNRQIAGTLSFFLLTADEQRIPIPHNDAAFKISRLKKFASTSAVPDTVSDLTNAALLIEVQNSDKSLLLRQIHPIAE